MAACSRCVKEGARSQTSYFRRDFIGEHPVLLNCNNIFILYNQAIHALQLVFIQKATVLIDLTRKVSVSRNKQSNTQSVRARMNTTHGSFQAQRQYLLSLLLGAWMISLTTARLTTHRTLSFEQEETIPVVIVDLESAPAQLPSALTARSESFTASTLVHSDTNECPPTAPENTASCAIQGWECNYDSRCYRRNLYDQTCQPDELWSSHVMCKCDYKNAALKANLVWRCHMADIRPGFVPCDYCDN
jgi:hypothetical protein